MTPGRIYKVHGFILKRRSAGEADRILTIFTKEYGKIRVIAKGVRKISSRRSGHTEVFRQVALTISRGKGLDVVGEATTLEAQPQLSQDLSKVTLAYYTCELVDQLLAERQEHRDIFILLGETLQKIADSNDLPSGEEILLGFAHQLLWSLGFLPRSQHLTIESIEAFVEGIIERKLRTRQLLTRLHAGY